jgi:hypothetical protein
MRQEAEAMLEEKIQNEEVWDNKVVTTNQECEKMKSQMNDLMDDKLKVEQTAEYWESSFKLIEKHYLEEKEKSEQEIERLLNQVNLQD